MSKHNLSYTRLQTFSMGQLAPIGCVEVLPGDRFVHRARLMARLSTLVAPIMHRVNVSVSHWFVPTRLIWDDFESFITNKTTPTYPTLTMPAAAGDTGYDLCEMLGAPSELANTSISALPIRAYNKIVNEFYRDQDLISARSEDETDLFYAAWEKDYFSTARTNPQQGSAVTFDLSGQAPITGIGSKDNGGASSNVADVRETDSGNDHTYGYAKQTASSALWVEYDSNTSGSMRPMLYADLDNANIGITVEEWRRAMGLQRFAELRARFGSRYSDYLRMLGVSPGDQRLQRPERLGSERSTVQFSEVLATAETGTSVDVGDQKGYGIAGAGRKKYRAMFPEHGYVISLACFRPKAIYANAVERHWLYRTFDDYFQPELELEGPQAVTNQEVKADHATPTGTFGYVERNNHLRRQLSQVMGLFKTTETSWHLARDFSSDPALNQTFLDCVPSTDPFADLTAPQLRVNVAHDLYATRIIRQHAKI
jgi:hypothetical protein